jgi:CRISPR-associated protein Csb2
VSALLIAVRFHDGRYHGRPEWPPSPARLFQALVSGAARGGKLNEEDARALGWLETLQPPVVAAPAMRRGHGFRNFVPNNDLDAVGGDPERIGKIRTPKLIRPILFDAETPLLFIWGFDDAPDARAHARQICFISERLYQLGRGVDMAWASGEVIDETEADARLAAHGGAVHRRSETGAGATLAAPGEGSLESLIARHQKMRVAGSVSFQLYDREKVFCRGMMDIHPEMINAVPRPPSRAGSREVGWKAVCSPCIFFAHWRP